MYRCEKCGRLYFEPDTSTEIVQGIYRYEKTIEICPFCYSRNGHTFARWFDDDELLELLEGMDYWELRRD